MRRHWMTCLRVLLHRVSKSGTHPICHFHCCYWPHKPRLSQNLRHDTHARNRILMRVPCRHETLVPVCQQLVECRLCAHSSHHTHVHDHSSHGLGIRRTESSHACLCRPRECSRRLVLCIRLSSPEMLLRHSCAFPHAIVCA